MQLVCVELTLEIEKTDHHDELGPPGSAVPFLLAHFLRAGSWPVSASRRERPETHPESYLNKILEFFKFDCQELALGGQ